MAVPTRRDLMYKNLVGFELNKDYCDIANARLKPLMEQENLNFYAEKENRLKPLNNV